MNADNIDSDDSVEAVEIQAELNSPISPPAATSTPPTAATNLSLPSTSVINVSQLPTRVSSNETNSSRRLTRKRQVYRNEWKSVKISKEYNHGQRYKRKGQVAQRKPGPRCSCKKTMYKCKEVSDDQRVRVFSSFWDDLGNATLRQNFIVAHVFPVQKKRQICSPTRHRGGNHRFTLPLQDGTTVHVCKAFFLSTLQISDQMVLPNLRKAVNGIRPPTIRPPPANKIPDDIKQTIRDHINKFYRIESHYCRSTTQREYLEPTLNKKKMYLLYQQSELNNPRVKQHLYSHVFDTEFNLGFHHPSKDQCNTCDQYERAKSAGVVTADMDTAKIDHDRRKDAARKSKESDKKNPEVAVFTYDLQQVLTCPKLKVGQAYYKRKLNCYNLTFYNLKSNVGDCFFWHEGECGRGANEIATAVIKMLQKLDEAGERRVVLYSDTCGAQNRNSILGTAIINFLAQAENITSVEQKFFESGHSQMECDSMHSAIEYALHHLDISIPSDFYQSIQMARRQKPYGVHEVTHGQIKDFRQFNSANFSNTAFAGIIKVHHIKYEANRGADPKVYMATDIDGEMEEVKYRKRGGKVKMGQNLPPAHSRPTGIDGEKKKDLLSLVDNLKSKEIGQLFYSNLVIKQ